MKEITREDILKHLNGLKDHVLIKGYYSDTELIEKINNVIKITQRMENSKENKVVARILIDNMDVGEFDNLEVDEFTTLTKWIYGNL